MPPPVSQPQRRSGALTLWGIPALVLAIGLVVLVLLVAAIQRADRARIDLETRITTRQVALRLTAWMDNRLVIPELLSETEGRTPAAVKASYRRRALPFLRLYPGIQALNYVSPDGIIDEVVPEKPNEPALGMSLYKHPSAGVREALERARSGNRPSATPVINLFQGGTGVVLYQAIRDQHQELLGLVNCVFRVDTLVNRCLDEEDLRRSYRFSLVDDFEQTAYLHTDQPDLAPDAWPFASDHPVRIVDRLWNLRVAPTDDFISHADSPYTEVQGALGIGLLLALVVTFHLLLRRQLALQESQSRYRMLVENQTDVLLKFNTDGIVLYASPSFCRLYGVTEDEVVGKGFVHRIHEDDRQRAIEGLEATRRPPDYEGRTEHRSLTRHGWRWMSWIGSGVLDEHGDVVATIATGRDITRQKELEDQLRQGQKMQAVGQLAGGIAHDFNNLLQAMLGYLEMLEQNPGIDDKNAQADLAAVKRSAQRASALTGQLLAFSRQTVRTVRVLDLGAVMRDLHPLLERLLPDSIELQVETPEDEALIDADRSQLEQVAMNLCVNARDAIDGDGRISMRVEMSDDDRWVRLVVTDNGRGIPAELQDRIFEPFYTTKEVGEGTGLGLATVYGIVEHHRGEIDVASEPGQGAVFTVSLPRSRNPRPADVMVADSEVPGGTETILLAEDEEALRDITTRVLEQAGYRVVAADDGVHALELYEQHGQIDMAVLDVMMPRLGGRDLAAELLRRRPNLPLIFLSGHPSEQQNQKLHPAQNLLLKPFDAVSLLRQVRRALDERS